MRWPMVVDYAVGILLTVILVKLRIRRTIEWPWWCVISPLWIPLIGEK